MGVEVVGSTPHEEAKPPLCRHYEDFDQILDEIDDTRTAARKKARQPDVSTVHLVSPSLVLPPTLGVFERGNAVDGLEQLVAS